MTTPAGQCLKVFGFFLLKKNTSSLRDHGFALLIVLWSLILVSLLTSQIIASGRTALLLASNLRTGAEAQAAADGAIYEAIFHQVIPGADHWPADGAVHLLQNQGFTIAVTINSLAGKINPNLASTALLDGLFLAVGADPDTAQHIATGIIQWRSPAPNKIAAQQLYAAYRRAGLPYAPPGHNFADLSELDDVDGMQAGLLAAAMPYMSLYQSGDPDPQQAAPIVRQALILSGQSGTKGNVYSGSSPVVTIDAVAGISGTIAVRRDATVSIIGQNGAVPFKLLSLTSGY